MGLLSDIGRANVAGQLVQYGQFVRQGEELSRRNALTNQALQKGALEIEKAQKEYEALHRKRPFEASILYQTTPEELRPQLLKAAKDSGYLSDEGMSMFERNQMLQESHEFHQIFLAGQEQTAQASVDKAISAWQKNPNQETEQAVRLSLAKLETVKKAPNEVARLLGISNKDEMTPYQKEQIRLSEERNKIAEKRADAAERRSNEAKNQLSFADKEAIRAMGKQLPKAKASAETAAKNVQKIDRMISLVEQGAGGVKGELMAKINKMTDLFRVTSPEDAKYNTLKAELRGLAGQLRMQLGLVGQTSDRDVAIMYEAAGGNSPAESQRAILEGYRQGYMQDIVNYNSDAKAYSEYSKAGGKLYPQIDIPGNATPYSPQETKKKKFKVDAAGNVTEVE